jgi:hypothetical protein
LRIEVVGVHRVQTVFLRKQIDVQLHFLHLHLWFCLPLLGLLIGLVS